MSSAIKRGASSGVDSVAEAAARRASDIDVSGRVNVDTARIDLSDVDYNRAAMGLPPVRVDAPNPGILARGLANLGTRARNLMPQGFRVKGDAVKANPSAKTTVDAGKSSPEVAKARQTKNATQADAEKVVGDAVPNTPEGAKLKQDADDLAKDPKTAETLKKWGLRGGVGILFLMLIYDTANPFEALGGAAEDTQEGVEGAGDLFSSMFEAFKGLLTFLTENWMISGISSCCCILLIMMPMFMNAGRSIAPRPRPYYGGGY